MAKSTEGTRFRHTVVNALRGVRQTLGYGVSDWNVRSTVYLEPHEREAPARVAGSRGYLRPRRPEEYPEVQGRQLARLHGDLEQSINELRELQAKVARRYHEVMAAQQTDGPGN